MKHASRLVRRGVVGVGVIALALLMPMRGALRSAQAIEKCAVPITLSDDDIFYMSYYDVATSSMKSAAGYGGASSSGGAGDGTVRIIDPTSAPVFDDAPPPSGINCAMLYVFDDTEEMQACCGCPVTSDGMRTFSVINDLTRNFGVNKGNLTAGVIDLISAELNFTPVPGIPPPNGVNLTGTTAGGCDPTGGRLNSKNQGTGEPVFTVSALRAWMIHTESEAATAPGIGFIQGVSVEEFKQAPLDVDHYCNLQDQCAFILGNGSGTGFCSCGAGENNTRPQS